MTWRAMIRRAGITRARVPASNLIRVFLSMGPSSFQEEQGDDFLHEPEQLDGLVLVFGHFHTESQRLLVAYSVEKLQI